MPRDDLSGLFAPPPAVPSQDARYRQGIVLAFDKDTLENEVEVGGTVLANLPVLGLADASLLVPGAVVGIIPVGGPVKTMYIIGRPIKTTAVPPRTVASGTLCTDGHPVSVCMASNLPDVFQLADPFQPELVDPEDLVSPGDATRQFTAGLVWTMPGDVPDGNYYISYSEDSERKLKIVGGVREGLYYTWEDGSVLPSGDEWPGYGLPDEDHGEPVDAGRVAATPLRWLNIGMSRDVGHGWDGLTKFYYGHSELQILLDEFSNEIYLFVQRPGVAIADGEDILIPTPDAAAQFHFTADGMFVWGGETAEADADPAVVPPLKVRGAAGDMHIGGRHIYTFDTDINPADLILNDMVVGADGVPVVASHRAHGEEQGTETVSFAAATSNTTAVVFATAFAAAPRVFGNIASTDASADGWTVRCANITTTGFDLYVSGPSASWSSIPVQWHALDGT